MKKSNFSFTSILRKEWIFREFYPIFQVRVEKNAIFGYTITYCVPHLAAAMQGYLEGITYCVPYSAAAVVMNLIKKLKDGIEENEYFIGTMERNGL